MPEQPPAPSPNASPEKSPDPATAKDPKTRLKELAAFVANQLSADLLLYSGPMELTGFLRAEKSCRGRKRRKNVLLILSTFGGDASAAYRLARCLQARYTKVIVFVSSMCKSAGTLVCLGAHELILSPEGELGPLDVQLRKPNEVYDYGSGLDPMQALDVLEQRALATFRTALMDIHIGGGISTKLAGDLATKLSVGLYRHLYSQLDPVRLGEIYRSMLIASDYGERLAERSENVRDGAIGTLVAGYPAHGFVIDLPEAARLFVTVRPPTEDEQQLADMLDVPLPDISGTLRVLWVDELLKDDDADEDADDTATATATGVADDASSAHGSGHDQRAGRQQPEGTEGSPRSPGAEGGGDGKTGAVDQQLGTRVPGGTPTASA